MRMMVIAGLVITLPAIVVIIWGLMSDSPFIVLAALASFGLNSIPFLVTGLILRSQKQKGHAQEAAH